MILAVSACGGGDDVDAHTGGMTSAALGALPVFNAVEDLTRLPASGGDETRSATGDDITDDYIRNFFKLECHMPDQQNDCPEEIEATTDNKYTVTTLIGLIYHAEMKMKDVFRAQNPTCGVGDEAGPITVSAASFVSDEGTGSMYIIDFFDLLGCVGHMNTPATSHFAYGTSTDKLVMFCDIIGFSYS